MTSFRKVKLVLLGLIIGGLISAWTFPSLSQIASIGWSTPQTIAYGYRAAAPIAIDSDGNWHIVYSEKVEGYPQSCRYEQVIRN